MIFIEKEYEMTLDDYLCFQKYFFHKNRNWWNTANLASITLSVFIIFLLQYVDDNTVIIMGIIITILNIMRIIIESINGHKLLNNYLKMNYYKEFRRTYIKIKIDENNISEYCNNYELKIAKDWIKKCINIKEYIYLINDKSFTIIIPKKYFSNEEQEIIINNYGKI